MNNLIGISGQLKCGKDLVGDMIMYIDEAIKNSKTVTFNDFENYLPFNSNYYIRKCADKLKDCVCLLLGCTRKQLEDREFKEKELGPEWWVYEVKHSTNGKSQLFPYIGASKQTIDYGTLIKLTPRKILQLLGTQGGRMVVHPNIWVNALFSDYKSGYIEQGVGWIETEDDYPNWIITDVRFPDNEGKAVLNRGGLMIGIRRLFKFRFPEYEDLIDSSDGYAVPTKLQEVNPELYKNLTHESESEMGDHSWCDVVIENNGTIEDLFNNVLKAIEIK